MKKDFKKIIEASHQTDRSLFNVVCIEKVGSGISPKADMVQTTIPIYLYEAFLVAGSTLFCHSFVDRTLFIQTVSSHISLTWYTLRTG